MSALLALAPVVVALVLAVAVIVESVGLMFRWTHPVRVLASALGSGFSLLLLALVFPLTGVLGIIWCGLLALAVLGVVLACLRAVRRDPPAPAGPGASWAQRRRARRATPPSIATVVANAVLLAALAVVALLAG